MPYWSIYCLSCGGYIADALLSVRRLRIGRFGNASRGPERISPLRVTPMPNKSPIMNLSRDEELFLHRWIYDEAHYEQGPGPAKRLQVEHRAVPAELADLIAASIPDPADQESMAHAPPSAEPPCWPWSEETFRARVVEARAMLESRRQAGPGKVQTRSQA